MSTATTATMPMRPLGHTDINVSVICLGTMTWGEQNSEAEAHEQMDVALDHGVNFWDTAELYAVPPREETYGLTEEYIGTWLAKNQSKRGDIVLASKIAGPGRPWIGGGERKFNKAHMDEALHGSLKRLQTDYIDLYQLHWPERPINNFGYLGFGYQTFPGVAGDTPPTPATRVLPWEDEWTRFEDTLEVIDGYVKAGKIRYLGLSNETPWGVMEFLRVARERGWPEVVSIQNPYSLLNRSYEVGLSEISLREGCGLLAYSPLGFGRLTGKYLDGKTDPNGRISKFSAMSRYNNDVALKATEAYNEVAKEFGVSLTDLSLAFINMQPFVTSNIIGATTMDQLKENIHSAQVILSPECFKAIEDVHQQYTYPCP
jgi:aryl-alcohol dehydrogenase-like predicted oxidoreductase